jgi:hypothetical protein
VTIFDEHDPSLLRLEVLNVSLNSIDGQITGLFDNKSSLGMLSVLDISQNQISGHIPGEFFAKGSNRSNTLREVAMYSNCFTGSLPATICDCHELNTIILDAVSSASSCRKKFRVLKGIFKVHISQHPLNRTIPSCVWTMSSLRALHLSGNNLMGTLGELVEGVCTLADVA